MKVHSEDDGSYNGLLLLGAALIGGDLVDRGRHVGAGYERLGEVGREVLLNFEKLSEVGCRSGWGKEEKRGVLG
jgi:hypothetical protein